MIRDADHSSIENGKWKLHRSFSQLADNAAFVAATMQCLLADEVRVKNSEENRLGIEREGIKWLWLNHIICI